MATHLLVQEARIPTFLYGTAWKEERTELLVTRALGAGFLGIDTANQRKHYHEAAVGAALARAFAEGTSARDALFLQSKFTYADGQDHRLPYDPKASYTEQVRQSMESSLEHLATTYIDSYVLHGPRGRHALNATDWEVWRAMEDLHREQKARLLGISNTNLAQLRELWEESKIKPAFVQNRCYASTGWDSDIRRFCGAHGIVYQAFSLLTANRRELRARPIESAAKRVHKTAAEVVFRFAQQVGMLPITGTTSAEHMQQDLEVGSFTLLPSEIEAIEHC